MKLRVRVKLNLPSSNNRLIIKYNTFEKATYDQYLIASIIFRTKSKTQAWKYIDEITGNGSLNEHFKKLYNEIYNFEDSELERILNSSLYPVLKIDDRNFYRYYPSLNISILNNKIYQGNLSNDQEFPKTLITEGEFHSYSLEEGKVEEKENMYNVLFRDESIQVEISSNIWVPISQKLFSESVKADIDVSNIYNGTISDKPEGNGWNILTRSRFNNIESAQSFYFEEGNHYSITNDYVVKTTIGNLLGLYIYRDERIFYEPKTSKVCEKVLDILLDNSRINEFKTKSLIQLLKQVSYEKAQKILNYLLNRKNSKELSLLGLEIIRKGYEKGWKEESIKSFKLYSESLKDSILVYRINPQLDFTIEELYNIENYDNTILNQTDKNKVSEYKQNKHHLIKSIDLIIGKVTNSGNREKTKQLPNDQEVKEYRNLANELTGHVKKDIKEMSLNELEKLYIKVKRYDELNDIMTKKLEKHSA